MHAAIGADRGDQAGTVFRQQHPAAQQQFAQEEEGNLVTERIWLRGLHSQRFALILNFYAGNQLPTNVLIAGTTLVGELVYFPSVMPMRALVKEQVAINRECAVLTGAQSILEMHTIIAAAIAQNPFTAQIPLIGNGMRIMVQNGMWYLVDADHQAIALSNGEAACWTALATTGGRAMDAFGLYENEAMTSALL